MNELEILQREVNELKAIVNTLVFSDRYIFQKDVEFLAGRHIQLASDTGTKIGTAATQKLGFFGATPVVQPAVPTTLADVIARLQALGLTA